VIPTRGRRLPALGLALVRGPSMTPALRDGDQVLVRYGAPVRVGDVVLARRPDRPELIMVKRAHRELPDGWWVLGDNPYGSDDSRLFGVVPAGLVLGRVVLRVWPPGRRVSGPRPWRRAGSG
jgi:nickel-type superoxide dismutase maturation protease